MKDILHYQEFTDLKKGMNEYYKNLSVNQDISYYIYASIDLEEYGLTLFHGHDVVIPFLHIEKELIDAPYDAVLNYVVKQIEFGNWLDMLANSLIGDHPKQESNIREAIKNIDVKVSKKK